MKEERQQIINLKIKVMNIRKNEQNRLAKNLGDKGFSQELIDKILEYDTPPLAFRKITKLITVLGLTDEEILFLLPFAKDYNSKVLVELAVSLRVDVETDKLVELLSIPACKGLETDIGAYVLSFYMRTVTEQQTADVLSDLQNGEHKKIGESSTSPKLSFQACRIFFDWTIETCGNGSITRALALFENKLNFFSLTLISNPIWFDYNTNLIIKNHITK